LTTDFVFRLASLKDDNLLILESGYLFHNTAAMTGFKDALANEKNQQFEAWLAQTYSDLALINA